MLTKLILRNFKRFANAEIELGAPVVFIGPNNSGKSTALQALALWDLGLKAWLEKRSGKAQPAKRPGVTINRRDLVAVPVPSANLLWHSLHVRDVQREEGRPRTQNVRIDITVEGVTNAAWKCGIEFDYSSEEAFICRPIREPGSESAQVKDALFTSIPDEVSGLRIAYLPPMSGLAEKEFIKQPGEIGFWIGQGQTAQVLRNLCWSVSQAGNGGWGHIHESLDRLFGVDIQPPELIPERSEITLQYRERGATLDLSSAGRGLQQTLLLLAYLYQNPQTVLLLDEPDAHLEVLRQRQTFSLISEVAEKQGSQVIAASHSEVVMNEAAGRGLVVAFVGHPHTINTPNRGSQLIKALTEIGWDLYYQAEQTGWILFVEGPSDLLILQSLARALGHPAANHLDRPFVHYVSTNKPRLARDLFHGLREAKQDLVGIAIFDRIEHSLNDKLPLLESQWTQREIENYLCHPDVLLRWSAGPKSYDLFEAHEGQSRQTLMREAISETVAALTTLGKPDPWGSEIKASDDFLDPLFRLYFRKLGLPITFRKQDYHELAAHLLPGEINPEITAKLDLIVQVASAGRPGFVPQT
jgi:hypothetical protein